MSNVGYYLALKENYYSCLPMIYNYFFIRVIRKLCMHLINPMKSNQQNPSHFNSRGLLLILSVSIFGDFILVVFFFFLLRPALMTRITFESSYSTSFEMFQKQSGIRKLIRLTFFVLPSLIFFPSRQAVLISFVLNQLEFCSSYSLNMYTNANVNTRGTLLPELILDSTSLDTTGQAP